MTVPLAERSYDAGVVTINYAEGPPNGPILVSLHGGSGRWQAGEDILVTDDEVERAMQLSPNVTHVKLENVGHALFVPDRQKPLKLVREFLASVQD